MRHTVFVFGVKFNTDILCKSFKSVRQDRMSKIDGIRKVLHINSALPSVAARHAVYLGPVQGLPPQHLLIV